MHKNILNPGYINSLTPELYQQQKQLALSNPLDFWQIKAHECVSWYKTWDNVLSGSFAEGNPQWFNGASLNVSYNCLDRHLINHAHKTAIIWQGDDPKKTRKITFAELHSEVAYFAQALLNLGV